MLVMKRLLIILFASLGLTSCFESTAFDTECILTPVVQTSSGDDYVDLEGVVCYAFTGTTDEWEIRSYEDALAGVVTSNVSGEQRSADAEASAYEGSSSKLSIQLENEFMIIVAVDPSSQIYTYIDYEIPENFYELHVTLSFLPWKVADYTVKSWNYVVPSFEELTLEVSLEQKLSSDADPTTLSGGVLYAFNGSSSDWEVTSYEDALAGVATAVGSGASDSFAATVKAPLVGIVDSSREQMSATAQGELVEGSDNTFKVILDEGDVILLVVDTVHKSYATSPYTVTGKVRTDSDVATFCLWQEEEHTYDGWSWFPTQRTMPQIHSDPMDSLTLE